MANGDEAAAEGMDVVPGTAKRGLGYDEINKTRDYIARFFNSISLSWSAITGKPASFPPDPHSHDTSQVTSGGNTLAQRIWIHTADTTLRSANDASQLWLRSNGQVASSQVRNTVVAGWLNVGVDAGGVIGTTASSRRYKRDIEDWNPGPGVLDINLRAFRFLERIDPTGTVDHGAIAEELDELGLSWAVVYEDGKPRAIRYELLGVALIPIVRDLTARIEALEAAG